MTGRPTESPTTKPNTQPASPVTPEQIMDEILVAAKAHAAATESFASKFMFYGKPLLEWSDELAVAVPDKPTPEALRSLYVKLANNIQIAGHFYSISSTITSTLVGGGQIKHADLVTAIVGQYTGNQKRPAAAVIEKMAESYMKSTTSTRVAAKLVKEFWRHRLDALTEVRKCLEQINMSLATELKYLSEDKF
jgi:hypothetical protein